MGRKKRAGIPITQEVAASYPAPLASFDPYGRPLPPPLPPPPSNLHGGEIPPFSSSEVDGHSSKRSRTEADAADRPHGEKESYLVKKYRPDSYYRSIEAFARYTKSHRMLDASYVRWTGGGGTPEKPIVFGIRIAGSFLSWGRGKTRDAAIDASIRAAFALVAAHGYDDFSLSDDCFTEEPLPNSSHGLAPIPPPPPPPPPLPPGAPLPPLPPVLPPGVLPGIPPSGYPPLPPGMPPQGMPPLVAPGSFSIPPASNDLILIPQPAALKVELAVASAVGDSGGVCLSSTNIPTSSVLKPNACKAGSIVGIVAKGGSSERSTTTAPAAANKLTFASPATIKKGNSKLVFSGDNCDEKGSEFSMEELRLRIPRYWNLLVRFLAKRNEAMGLTSAE